MKNIQVKNVNFKNAVLVHSDADDDKIWRLGKDRYILTAGKDQQPIHGFKSSEFSKLLNLIEGELVHYGLMRNFCMMCSCKTGVVEIQLMVKGGDVYRVDRRGFISKCTKISL